MSRYGRAVDALGAMYFLAAVLLGIGAVIVVALMFLPSDLSSRGRDRWVPGATPESEVPAPTTVTPEQRRANEELHMH